MSNDTVPALAAIRDTATDEHLEQCSCAQNVLILLDALEANLELLGRYRVAARAAWDTLRELGESTDA